MELGDIGADGSDREREMRKRNFQPKALPRIPETDFVYHVCHRVSPLGKSVWTLRKVRYASYVLRLRYHGDDGLYFASEAVANDVRAVKEAYEKNVLNGAVV